VATADADTTGFESLLSPGRIGELELRNRILLSPMGSNLCLADGHLGERILRYYEERARGGVGLVTVGVGAIAFPEGACNPNQVAISDDAFLPGLQELPRRVHAHGCKAAIQLQHAGKVAVRDIVAGRPLWVPSILPYKAGDLTQDLTPAELQSFTKDLRRKGARMAFREMTEEDVATVVERFADAALRARRAGFDGVELHAGHGYILSSFLSPASNQREDRYGGPLENRARFLVETIRAAKQRAGADFPIWCRIDAREFRTEAGICEEDAQQTAKLAEAAGADAIHVSAYADASIGAAFTEAPLVHQPSGYVPFAEAIKKRLRIPVIAVGRIEPDEADALIARGGADFVAMARKLLADPELARKLAEGRAAEIRPCIYCYTCVGRVFLSKPSACAVNPLSGREFEHSTELAATPRHVLIVGAGPAGMEAARIAALRGHSVTLCERAAQTGGALRISSRVNPANGRLLDWLNGQLEVQGVELHLETEMTAEGIAAHAADVVLVATGARRPLPEVPGADSPRVWRVDDLLDVHGNVREPGKRLAVVGGGGVALSVADHFSQRGHAVQVLAEGSDLGGDTSPPSRWRTLARLRERGVGLVRNARIDSLEDGRVRYVTPESEAPEARSGDSAEHVLEADTVLIACGWQPDASLMTELAQRGIEAHLLGDCRHIGRIEGAIADAGAIAWTL
jgi:2,4-dienoyl-CoA reductase-like NADH-dependent reductase (Old Yellow Enzyme family)/thioredoxin reductase